MDSSGSKPMTTEEKIQEKLDKLSPGRFVVEEIEETLKKSEGKIPRTRTYYRVRVEDKECGIKLSLLAQSLTKALKRNSGATFYDYAAGDLSERYQAKVKALNRDSRYEIIDHVSTTEKPYETVGRSLVEVAHVFLFWDKERDVEFECGWDAFRRFSGDLEYTFRPKDPTQKYQERLNKAAPGRYEVKEVRGYLVDILDTHRDLLIENTSFHRFVLMAERDPTYNFRDPITAEGASVSSLSESTGYSKSHLYYLFRTLPDDILASTVSAPKQGTFIEAEMRRLLQDEEVVFDRVLEGTTYRPDLYLPEKGIIVECDGLYWHSEAKLDKKYHKEKKLAYTSLGMRSFFFREDEIRDKRAIVSSIISNAMGGSRRVYARKTKVVEIAPSFFEENHLMGKGSGKCYGLVCDGECVAGIRVRWISVGARYLDVSRFCTAGGVSVVGGFSKLISHVVKEENPLKIRTFIDLRYENGSYLSSLGWKLKGSSLSFAWTDYKTTWHRMRFPGNSGYEKGLKKIWDCGQALWELIP